MEIVYSIDDINNLDEIFLLTVFRVCQELITNSIKHSEGTKLSINVIRENDNVFIEVCDDGKGIALEEFHKTNHFGLEILRERVSVLGGRVSFPTVEKGTKVIIEIPILRMGTY